MDARALVDPDSIALVSVDDERAERIARQMDPRIPRVPPGTVSLNGDFYRLVYGKAT
jgi:hypothetical protein